MDSKTTGILFLFMCLIVTLFVGQWMNLGSFSNTNNKKHNLEGLQNMGPVQPVQTMDALTGGMQNLAVNHPGLALAIGTYAKTSPQEISAVAGVLNQQLLNSQQMVNNIYNVVNNNVRSLQTYTENIRVILDFIQKNPQAVQAFGDNAVRPPRPPQPPQPPKPQFNPPQIQQPEPPKQPESQR
jgi:hypothetical protein